MTTLLKRAASPWSAADQVAWHEIECGHYQADLALWRELAGAAQGPVLDIGAGTGRVTLDLARRGHQVIAVDIDVALSDELRRRARGLPVCVLTDDARKLPPLAGEPPHLCLVPMQTVQLLGGADGRGRFFAALRARLAPGALVALAIGEALDTFDSARDPVLPRPDRGRFGDISYISRPTAVRAVRGAWVLERERVASGPAGTRRAPDSVRLDRVGRRDLEREAAAHGLRAEPPRAIPETSEHVPSTVVMLRA